MSGAQKTLKVLAIITIVFAVIAIIAGLMGLMGGGILGAASGTSEVQNALTSEGYSASDGSYLAIVVVFAGFVALIEGVIDLIVGILGLRGANDPSKIGPFRIICIVGIVLAIINLLLAAITTNPDASTIISAIISLVLIIWCFYLANKIKNQNLNA